MMKTNLSEETLLNVISRLENCISKLEGKKVDLSASMLTTENIAAFTDYWNKTLHNLIELRKDAKETNLAHLDEISEHVAEALCAHQDLLIASQSFKKPATADIQQIIKKFSSINQKVIDLGKAHPEISLHADAAKNGLQTIFWIFNETGCDAITQTHLETIDFPGNKIFMKKVPAETKWIRTLKATIKEIDTLVKANYRTGLTWNAKGDNPSDILVTIGNTFRKNFKKESSNTPEVKPKVEDNRNKLLEQINFADLRKSLKPIGGVVPLNNNITGKDEVIAPTTTTTMKKQEEPVNATTTSEPKLAVEPVSVAAEPKPSTGKPSQNIGRRVTLLKRGKVNEYNDIKKSFTIENLEDENIELEAEKTQFRSVVDINNCYNCFFKVPKKVNAIRLTNCENVRIVCDSIVSIFEIINCLKITVGVEGIVSSFSIDGSTNVKIHMNKHNKNPQIYACKSMEVILMIQKEEDDGDYTEYAIPEQFIHVINEGKLETRVSDLYNY